MTVSREALQACAAGVVEPLRDMIDRLRALAQAAATRIDVDKPSKADVDGVRPAVQAALAQSPGVNGLGIVLAPGLLTDAELHLEWWRAMSDGSASRLLLDLDPASENYYDYPDRDWFAAPAQGALLGVLGPYVDYRGADEYVFTLAVPILGAERFLGVAGVDYPLAVFEERVLPCLRGAGPGVVLVNRDQRVIAGGSARWRPGERLRPPSVSAQVLVAASRVAVEPVELGWSVVDLSETLDK